MYVRQLTSLQILISWESSVTQDSQGLGELLIGDHAQIHFLNCLSGFVEMQILKCHYENNYIVLRDLKHTFQKYCKMLWHRTAFCVCSVYGRKPAKVILDHVELVKQDVTSLEDVKVYAVRTNGANVSSNNYTKVRREVTLLYMLKLITARVIRVLHGGKYYLTCDFTRMFTHGLL